MLTFIAILAIKKKKINNMIFKSPMLIIYKINISFTRRCIAKSLKSRGSSSPKLRSLGDKVWVITEVAKFNPSQESLVNPDPPAKVACRR